MKSSKKIILFLFFASGISSLIYQISWLRIISRITGSTVYATSIVLAIFIAGLGLGSFLFGRFIDRHKNHLKIYAILELLIGVTAVIVTGVLNAFFPIYEYFYQISGQNIGLAITIRTIMLSVCILLPTILMGGTLPVLTSYMVKKDNLFGKNFSLLYGLNTFGAVVGVLLAGFITIGLLGEWYTVIIAAVINLLVAGVAFFIFTKRPKNICIKDVVKLDNKQDILISPYSNLIRRIVLISFLISGFTALAYEVIWSRQLILFLKTSIYAFSGMLALFLTGIALGSVLMNRLIDNYKRPLVAFGRLEIMVGVLSILNLYLFRSLDNLQALFDPFSGGFLVAVVLVFPLALLFGAIFPLASLCYAKSVNKVGSSVGYTYGFNAIGSILGALTAGFFFIPFFGSVQSIIFLALINIVLGIILLLIEQNKPFKKIKWRPLVTLMTILFLVIVFSALKFKQRDPFLGVIEDRIKKSSNNYEIFYNHEGTEGTVTCLSTDNRKGLLINGIGQTHLGIETKLMAHLPIIIAKEPKEVLVISFGMGTTVMSASIHSDLNITSVELVPEVYECFKYYHSDAEKILNQKNINFVTGDGRNFLLFSQKKYDVITVDPSPPIYSAGTVNLYSREFLSSAKEHLTQNGIMALWFPSSTRDEFNYIARTFYEVFPNMTVWSGPYGWGFYFLGTRGITQIDKAEIENALNRPEILNDLNEYEDDDSYITAEQLLNLLLWEGNEIKIITQGVPVVSDNFPYTEFPLWRYLLHGRKQWIPKIQADKFNITLE